MSPNPAIHAIHTGSAAQPSSSSADGAKLPSIFDILAQESLAASMKPGLRNLAQFLSLWYPRHLKVADKCFDEVYALFNLMLENHYLKRYSASFSENFYGMKRVFLHRNFSPEEKVGRSNFASFRQRLRSLVVLVFLPYIADKIEMLQRRLLDALPHQRTRFAALFLRAYPLIRAAVAAICLAFQLLYTFSYISDAFAPPASSPFLWLAGVFLERLTPADVHRFDSVPYHLRNSGVLSRLWRLLLALPSLLGRIFSYGLFFVQFLEYFYANDFTKELMALGGRGGGGPATAPPHPHEAISECQAFRVDPGKCPLCYRKRINDTALAVSGYVFCYACIVEYVRLEHRCPITSLPANFNALIRVYR